MSDIDDYLAVEYHRMHDGEPIEAASRRIEPLLSAWRHVTLARASDPSLYPGPVWADASDASVARRVIGYLLEMGWDPPSTQQIADALARRSS